MFVSSTMALRLALHLSMIVYCIHLVFSQSNSVQDTCRGFEFCANCIQDPNCAWCIAGDYEDVRCDLAEILTNATLSGCQNATFPMGQVDIIQADPLSNAAATEDNRAIQISPQIVNVTLKVGETQRVQMNVRLAEDYPLDIYYLTDLSNSFLHDLRNVRNLAAVLISRLNDVTSDLRIGLGGFVDKTGSPFVTGRDITECLRGNDDECCETCEQPFTYRNYLSLTNNTGGFEDAVKKLATSSSLDSPEGGFDALAQVISCQDLIGWRENARRMIFLATDATPHLAGDGKLAGISKPHDGKCRIDPESNEYKRNLEMDYPSIGQINSLLQENNIILVIGGAVNDEDNQIYAIYNDMLKLIRGAEINLLGADSGMLVNLIILSYRKVTEQLEVFDNAPGYLDVSYTANCFSSPPVPGPLCDFVSLGEEFSFDVDITLQRCPADEERQTFTISPVGLPDSMTVQIDVICKCDCEDNTMRSNDTCNGKGDMVCGQCQCDEGQYGDTCQCNEYEAASPNDDDESACFASVNSTVQCTGRGSCLCGRCVCTQPMGESQVVSGKFCECDNFSCEKTASGELCGGERQGRCVCGKCQCTSEYEGTACDCLKSTEACETPTGLLCNGFGDCTCGSCVCDANSPFEGSTCSSCATQACNGLCPLFQECALCAIPGEGRYTEEQCDICQVPVIVVESINVTETAGEVCRYNVEGNCTITYTYELTVNGTYIITIEKDEVCIRVPPENLFTANLQWWLLGIIGIILLLGLIIIALAKVTIRVKEKIEYNRFVSELKSAKTSGNENPLFKSTITTFRNPKYGL